MANETPSERGRRHLRDAGYSDHEKKRAKKRKAGGAVHGESPAGRPDRRARGGRMEAFDWPNDAQGNDGAASARADGGRVDKKGGKTIININQGDPQREQQARQEGMQQGVQLGAKAAAAKLAGGAGGPPGGMPPGPPGGGGPPHPPMMPPGGGGMPPPGMGGGMPPPGAGAMPPRPPMGGAPMPGPGGGPPMPMRRAGGIVRRDMAGRFAGGAI